METDLENHLLEGIHYSTDASDTISYVTHLIQKRAYELFEARGSNPGHELDDWLRAEREIRSYLGLWL